MNGVNVGQDLVYGIAPGVRFAMVLDGKGGSKEIDFDHLKHWTPEQGVLWIHLERDEESCKDWLHTASGLDPLAIEALLADESRPRCEGFDDALLMVLRGVNHNEREEPVDLVPVHLWCDANRVISLRDKGHFLMALRDIRSHLSRGHGPRTVGGLFSEIVDKIVRDLDPLVDEIEEDVDSLDDDLMQIKNEEARHRLSEIRRDSTKLRRYVAPQRETLFRLQHEEVSWLPRREKILLREVTDRLLRYIESLDSVRDRATILHEDLTSRIGEQISKNSHRLTAVAAILLPPSTIAGIFGMNLGGLPGNESHYGFLIVVVMMVVLMPLEYWFLKKFKWI